MYFIDTLPVSFLNISFNLRFMTLNHISTGAKFGLYGGIKNVRQPVFVSQSLVIILLWIAQLSSRKMIWVYPKQLFDLSQFHNTFRNHVKVIELTVLLVIKLIQEPFDHIPIMILAESAIVEFWASIAVPLKPQE